MQWGDGPNAGFSTADKDHLYLPLDPRRNRPTVERQAGDPGSLLNHVRNLIALRKGSSALQADGTLIPLPVENNDRHFAYLRQAGRRTIPDRAESLRRTVSGSNTRIETQ